MSKSAPILTPRFGLTIIKDGIPIARSASIKIPSKSDFDYSSLSEEDDDYYVGSYKDYLKRLERQRNLETLSKVVKAGKTDDITAAYAIDAYAGEEDVFIVGNIED